MAPPEEAGGDSREAERPAWMRKKREGEAVMEQWAPGPGAVASPREPEGKAHISTLCPVT